MNDLTTKLRALREARDGTRLQRAQRRVAEKKAVKVRQAAAVKAFVEAYEKLGSTPRERAEKFCDAMGMPKKRQ